MPRQTFIGQLVILSVMPDGWDSYPDDWDERRRAIYQRDGYECQNCGRRGGVAGDTELHCHHIVPKSEGGSHAKSNLVTLCRDCHNQVHDHYIPRMSEVSSGSQSQNAGLDDWQSSTQASESLQAVANKHFEPSKGISEKSTPTQKSNANENLTDTEKSNTAEISNNNSLTNKNDSHHRVPKRTTIGVFGWIMYVAGLFVFFNVLLNITPNTSIVGPISFTIMLSWILIKTSSKKKKTATIALLFVPVYCLIWLIIETNLPPSTVTGVTTILSITICGICLSMLETSYLSRWKWT